MELMAWGEERRELRTQQMNISGEKPVIIKSCIFCDRPQEQQAFWPGNKWKYNGSSSKQDKGLCQAARCLNKQLLQQRSDSTFIC